VGIRDEVHALVDQLDERTLALAEHALAALRDDGFDLSAKEEQELRLRENACDRGETMDARRLLALLRGEGERHPEG
jgi:hypothetical protein